MVLVAVTGATGFLGRSITAALARRGWRVRALSRTGTPAGEEVVTGDFLDPGACRRLVDGADVVVHAGGLVRAHDPVSFHAVNQQGTALLARLAADAGVARFVHVSSTGVYGLPGARLDERSPLRPRNAYEHSKAAAELELRAIADRLHVVVARPSNVVGPGHPLRPLLRLMRRLRTGPVWASPRARANYVDVGSVGQAVACLAGDPDPPAAVILNQPLGLEAFLSLVADSMGAPLSIHRVPRGVEVIARPLCTALSTRVPGARRSLALFDRTEFTTVHMEWLRLTGAVPDLAGTLPGMVAGYQAEGLL